MDEMTPIASTVDKLAAALAKAQGEFKAVQKTGRNPHLRNEYATLDDIIGAIRAPLAKHSLSFVQLLGSNGEGVTLRTILLHESGQQLESTVVVDSAEQKGISNLQALGAAITYMKRYSLSAMLGIAADVDTDGEGTNAQPKAKPEPAPEPPKQNGGNFRPLSADMMRQIIRKKSGWQDDRRLQGEPITEHQIPAVAGKMTALFPNLLGDVADKARHDVLAYLLTVTTTKALTKHEASALLDWMQDQETARIEAARIIEAIAVDAGQERLPL